MPNDETENHSGSRVLPAFLNYEINERILNNAFVCFVFLSFTSQKFVRRQRLPRAGSSTHPRGAKISLDGKAVKKDSGDGVHP